MRGRAGCAREGAVRAWQPRDPCTAVCWACAQNGGHPADGALYAMCDLANIIDSGSQGSP